MRSTLSTILGLAACSLCLSLTFAKGMAVLEGEADVTLKG